MDVAGKIKCLYIVSGSLDKVPPQHGKMLEETRLTHGVYHKLLKTVVVANNELTLIDIIVLIGYENNYSLKT